MLCILDILNRYHLEKNITGNVLAAPGRRSDSFRLLVGVWFLASLVLVNSYSGLLMPFMTVRKMKPAIDSFEDLVSEIKQPGITLAVNTDGYIGSYILVYTFV